MRIAASLASAPLQNLGQVVGELEAAGVDCIHFDVEDGSFVPCMNLGTKILGDLRALTRIPFDVHLMVVEPEWLLPSLAEMGANRVSIHLEGCAYPRRVLRQISSLGMTAGLALNPITPVPDLSYLAPYIAFVLILTTEPEIPDAPYLAGMLDKLRTAKGAAAMQVEWVVDGGIRPENIAEVRRAGADMVVVGRGLFGDQGIEKSMRALRAAAS